MKATYQRSPSASPRSTCLGRGAMALACSLSACGGAGGEPGGAGGGTGLGGAGLGGAGLGGAGLGAAGLGGAGLGGQGGWGGGGQAGGSPGGAGGLGGQGGAPQVCAPLSSEPCYEGPSGTEWVGLCAPGARSCAPDGGAWGPCVGQVLPTSETCGSPGDDDCDGTPNEEGPDCQCVPGSVVSCFSGPPEAVGVGVCVAGQQVCEPSGLGFGPCQGEVVPTPELCSTDVDDDCDGAVNEEGVDCVCTPFAAVPCYDGPPETAGVGLCAAGVAHCDSQGLSLSACAGQVLPGVEVCSGDVVDEDCDGEVNEGGPGCVCAPGVIESCYTGPPASIDRGPCHGGERQCNASGTAFGPCLGEVVPILDVCGTERREDCFHHYPECPAVCAGFETVMPVEPGDVVTPGSGQNSFGQAGWFLHQGASGPRFIGAPGASVPVTVTDLAPTGLFELHAMTTYQIHGYLDGSIDIAGPGNVGTGLVTVVLWHPTPHAKPSVGGNYGDRLYASHPDRLVTFEGTSHLFGQAFTAPYGGRDVLVGDQTGWSTLIGGPGDEHVVAVSESPMLDFAMTFDQPVQLGGYVVDLRRWKAASRSCARAVTPSRSPSPSVHTPASRWCR
jgi:hypothetical protein